MMASGISLESRLVTSPTYQQGG